MFSPKKQNSTYAANIQKISIFLLYCLLDTEGKTYFNIIEFNILWVPTINNPKIHHTIRYKIIEYHWDFPIHASLGRKK